MNLPPSEAWWPWAPKGNDNFKDDTGIFSHTYPERYWPKWAGWTEGGRSTRDFPFVLKAEILNQSQDIEPGAVEFIDRRRGIRFEYGDLGDLIKMMADDPLTRQAYLPVWFPEDLGAPMTERKPCTLGYHFIMRDNKLHIIYYIRSCDFLRHFRNDIYMTTRLQHWVLDQLKHIEMPPWKDVIPGSFTMHITSLHLFVNDYQRVFNG